MQVKRNENSKTNVRLTITADDAELNKIKEIVILRLGRTAKVAGFRSGKAPLHILEKHLDQTKLQSEFLDEAINALYAQAITKESIRAFGVPNISLSKFVPFTTLEFQAEVDMLSEVNLADYKKIKKSKPIVKVEESAVLKVLASLQEKSANRLNQDGASKSGDEVIIDFAGVDSKNQPIKDADGKDYPLILGSKSFIPGFEENLIGLKKGAKKSFSLTFPKDYGVKALTNKKVKFTVSVKQVNKIVKSKLDDAFASSVGPFKTLKDLKTDIKQHLIQEKQQQSNTKFESELIKQIVEGSDLELPQSLVDEQAERLKTEIRQNLTYRGQTWQEMLESLKLTEEKYIEKELIPEARTRVKTGLVLAEISSLEKLQVTQEELDRQMQELLNQYKDEKMQAELNKPKSRQEIASRLITQKTIQHLVNIVSK